MNPAELIRIAKDWLPFPVYRFVGGPIDGEERAVDLIEHPQGMIPPPLFQVVELPPVDFSDPAPVAVNATCRIHLYRFMPDYGSINAGHYEWVAQ